MAPPLVAVDGSLRVAVLASTDDPRLRYLLDDDPDHGAKYDIVCGVVNVADSDVADRLAARGVPVTRMDIHDFYDARDAPLSDMAVRREFDARVAESLAPHDPDLVVLAGYLHVLTAPLVDRYFPRIVNAHHADLTVRDDSGEPVYTGLRAVADAIRSGEPSTRETTHVVTEAVDRGPILCRSRPFRVHRDLVDDALARGADDVLDAYVHAHRRWMAREGGGRALAKTIELLADGRVGYEDGGTSIDGDRGYYQLGEGVRATGAPDPAD